MNDYLNALAQQSRNVSLIEIDLADGAEGIESILSSGTVRPRFVTVRHEKQEDWTTIIHLSSKNDLAFDLLVRLSEEGFLVYRASKTGTQLVHRDSVAEVWPALMNGEYERDSNGIVYRYTGPRAKGKAKSLAVVFSSVHSNMYTQKLERHFAPVFPMLESSVGSQTAVLRIADLDGVVGGFYLPTKRDPESTSKIVDLIRRMASSLDIPMDRVVTLGPSKGGTGALYCALELDVSCVSIDPIITNNRLDTREEDRYFATTSIFESSRDEMFDEAFVRYLDRGLIENKSQFSVITSQKSVEYDDICKLKARSGVNNLHLIETTNEQIQAHHEVAPKTVAFALGLLNVYLSGLSVSLSDHNIID